MNRTASKSASLQKYCGLLAAAGVFVLALVSVNTMRASWSYFKAEKAMAIFSDQGEHRDPKYLLKAHVEIENALKRWPDNPDYLLMSAQVEVWLGHLRLLGAVPDYDGALGKIRLALAQRPSHARSWAMLAEYKAFASQRDQEMFHAREKALELGGANQRLVQKMLRL